MRKSFIAAVLVGLTTVGAAEADDIISHYNFWGLTIVNPKAAQSIQRMDGYFSSFAECATFGTAVLQTFKTAALAAGVRNNVTAFCSGQETLYAADSETVGATPPETKWRNLDIQ